MSVDRIHDQISEITFKNARENFPVVIHPEQPLVRRNHDGIAVLFRLIFFFQAEDGIRDRNVTGVQTCALPISVEIISPSFLLSGKKLGLMISTAPEHPNLATALGLAQAALDRGANVYLYLIDDRSEERRVGKECRSKWSRVQRRKKGQEVSV